MVARSRKQTLDDLIDLFTPEIRDAFIVAIQNVTDTVLISQLIKAIEDGDPELAFQILGFSEAAMRPITAALERAFEAGGVFTGEKFPKYVRTGYGRGVFRFDVRNARAEATLRDISSRLIIEITEDARLNTRNTLQRGMIDGRNPRSVALDLIGRIDQKTGHRSGGLIGLTSRQETWVANTRTSLDGLKGWLAYERSRPANEGLTDAQLIDNHPYFARELRNKKFDAIVRNALRDGVSLHDDTRERLVTAYKNNALRYRGEVIARTEAMQALNASELETYRQAVENGALRQQDVSKHWDDAGDSRTRHSHAEMGKRYAIKGVGLDEPFLTSEGVPMMCPGDTSMGATGKDVIQCRCRVRYEVDFLAAWDD